MTGSSRDSSSGSDSESEVDGVPPVKEWKWPPIIPNVHYTPGPLSCPGVYNRKPSQGKIVRKYAYAVPLTEDDIYGFLDRYWPEPIPRSFRGIRKLALFFNDFHGRPKGTLEIVVLQIPLLVGAMWPSFSCVIGYNSTQERIQKAEDSQDLVLKMQEYFNTERAPGWYRFTLLGD